MYKLKSISIAGHELQMAECPGVPPGGILMAAEPRPNEPADAYLKRCGIIINAGAMSTPSNAELLDLAAGNPPPQSWYDEEANPFE